MIGAASAGACWPPPLQIPQLLQESPLLDPLKAAGVLGDEGFLIDDIDHVFTEYLFERGEDLIARTDAPEDEGMVVFARDDMNELRRRLLAIQR